MRVEASISCNVIESNNRTVLYVVWAYAVPGLWTCEVWTSVVLRHDGQRLVLHDPDIVLILVGIEGDLLLLATSRIHVAVGVKVPTLGVPMSNGDAASEGNISRDGLHTLRVQGCLELRGHESIAFTGVDEAYEVNSEHGHVKRHWDNNQAKQTGEEVLEPQPRSHIFGVSKQNPEL